MRDPKHDTGTPDWRDASAYPDPEDMTDSQWRWEFLRRHPDYRKAWISNYDECQARYDRLHAEGLIEDRDFYRAVGATYRSVCQPFGVDRIMAPWCEYSRLGPHFWKPSFGWSSLGPISEDVPIASLVAQHRQWDDQGVMLLAFDLNRPWDEQIVLIKAHFEAAQMERHADAPKVGRLHKKKWPKYLRAIDARDKDETYADLYLEIELATLPPADYDAALDGNLTAKGLQLFKQAQDVMFKAAS